MHRLFPGSSIFQTTLDFSRCIFARAKEVIPLCSVSCQQILFRKTLESVKTHNVVLHVGHVLWRRPYLTRALPVIPICRR